jgi:hypothetical protein
MPKTKISEYSQTAASNTDIDGININEGCPPSTINNAIRELMAQIKDFQVGAAGDGLTVSTLNATTATLGVIEISSYGAITATSANISGALTTATANITTATIGNILHEGTEDDFETNIVFTDPTADQTITFPDDTGTVALTSQLPSNASVLTKSGTYGIAGTTVLTVTSVAHGLSVNDTVYLNFTSGDAVDGNYVVQTVPDDDTFTVTHGTSITTSGNVTGYYSNLGLVEIASNDEVILGTSTTRIPTVAGASNLITERNKNYLNVQQVEAVNVAGGTFTSGDWRDRVLNTEVTNTISGASLASNQITLPAGTYYINAKAISNRVNLSQLRFFNTSDSTLTLLGMSFNSQSGDQDMNLDNLQGRFTIAGTKNFKLQHRCSNTRSTDGFGSAVSWGDNIYVSVEIWKLD